MVYKKIKLSFIGAKSRFNRTVLVASDINLVKLGCVFCTALGAEFEHNFLFETKEYSYLPDSFIKEGLFIRACDLPMKNYTLKDLGATFTFEYDTGEGWDFECKVSNKDETKDGNRIAYLDNGKGQGIWEDNSYSLRMYLAGKIDPECEEENEEEGIFFPWNCPIIKFGDFDTEFDLEWEKENFDDMVYFDMSMYLADCHDYGNELEVQDEIDPDDPWNFPADYADDPVM